VRKTAPSTILTWVRTWVVTLSSEATLLGTSLGVKPQVLADIINNSTGRSWSSEVCDFARRFVAGNNRDKNLTADCYHQINHPDPAVKVGTSSPPAHRQYEGGFVTKLAHKDLGLAVRAAEEAGVSLELGKRCEEIYRPLATGQQWSNRDFSCVLQALRDLKGRSGPSRPSL